MIFKLPQQFGVYPHPLAYVEWFTRLRDPDPTTGMYHITRSTRNHRPNAEVVSIDRITRGCHLIPKAGSLIDRRWTKDNCLELGKYFMVSRYISLDTFSAVYDASILSVNL